MPRIDFDVVWKFRELLKGVGHFPFVSTRQIASSDAKMEEGVSAKKGFLVLQIDAYAARGMEGRLYYFGVESEVFEGDSLFVGERIDVC